MFKPLKNTERYWWTRHVFEKMRYYSISENRVQRIIRFPKRIEEGIVPETVAVMQPAGTKKYQEIWVMYKLIKPTKLKSKTKNLKPKIKIITAWRYPGKSPERDPVPQEIIEEVKKLL